MTPSRRRTAWLLIAAIAVVVPACGPSPSVATDAEAPAANASRDGHASPAQVAPLDLAWEQLAAFDLVPPAAETPDTADAPATMKWSSTFTSTSARDSVSALVSA